MVYSMVYSSVQQCTVVYSGVLWYSSVKWCTLHCMELYWSAPLMYLEDCIDKEVLSHALHLVHHSTNQFHGS